MSALSAVSAGISRREFARREGVTDKIIRRAIDDGHLQTLSDGTLDPALVGTGWRKANRRSAEAADSADKTADKSAGVSAPGPQRVRTFVEPQPHGGGLKRSRQDESDDPIDADAFVTRALAGEVYKVADSERVKESALAIKHMLAARQAAGELVEIAKAEAILFEASRAARDSWLNWPSRVGPLIAADLGIAADLVTDVLTKHVQSHLADLGEPDADFAARPG